ncbi:MAG: hypothetical protein ACP6IQ_09010 [Candidatus Njordarchaeia archaeon]
MMDPITYIDPLFFDYITRARKVFFIRKNTPKAKDLEKKLKKYIKKHKKKNLTGDLNVAIVIGFHPHELNNGSYYNKVLYGSLQRAHKIFFIIDIFLVEDIQILSKATLLNRVQRIDPKAIWNYLNKKN